MVWLTLRASLGLEGGAPRPARRGLVLEVGVVGENGERGEVGAVAMGVSPVSEGGTLAVWSRSNGAGRGLGADGPDGPATSSRAPKVAEAGRGLSLGAVRSGAVAVGEVKSRPSWASSNSSASLAGGLGARCVAVMMRGFEWCVKWRCEEAR